MIREGIKTVEYLLDSISRGLIYVDSKGYIQGFSKHAKEITGVIFESSYNHEAGRIKEGDIVIIADNELCNDDEMHLSDLKLLNINSKDIKEKDALLCIGVYKNEKVHAEYKNTSGYQPTGNFSLEKNIKGNHIKASIDFGRSVTMIEVNGLSFPLEYFEAIGNLVIIDGETNNVKFFQSKGYSIRGEDSGLILRGKPYGAKKSEKMMEETPTSGANIMDIIYKSDFTNKIFSMIKGEGENSCEGIYQVNKRITQCTFVRGKDENGQIDGVYIIIEDATKLDQIIEQRNKLIEEIEGNKKTRAFAGKTLYPVDAFKEFIGSSPCINEVKKLAYKAAKANFTVLITGESGTGKSILAREIHRMQGQFKPFVEVNCNAIAPSLFESELFGYIGGAFTGALANGKKGYFEEANGGTIFLDEIGEIPLEMQIKLLQVLQNKTIFRVGSSKPISINVRVIVATNRDLDKEVAIGRFRQDLYYRINAFPIEVPPLRDRKQDLNAITNAILNKICSKFEVEEKGISEEAFKKMMKYDWPGNVRELENIIERALTICDSKTIYSEHIKVPLGMQEKKNLKEMLQEQETKIINETLISNNGDKKKTMEELGISKSYFYRKN